VSFSLKNSSLHSSGEIAECSVLSEITGRVLENSAECHQINYDVDRCTEYVYPRLLYQISQRLNSGVNIAITPYFNFFLLLDPDYRCRSGFMTLPPAPLPESSPLWFFFLEWAQIAQGVGYEGIRWTRGFTWFSPPERNTLRPRVNGVVLLCLSVRLKSPSR
jgi:hypothetical protein